MLARDEGKSSERPFFNFTAALGPGAVDCLIREAIKTCWMMLPMGKRTAKELEAQIRRLVDRALQNLNEDAEAFGSE